MHRLAPSLLLFASGCGGTLEPEDVAGTYRLTAVDAGPLPYLVYATAECEEHISGGQLTLTADGGFALRFTSVRDCSGGAGSVVSSEPEYSGVFFFEGRHLYLNGAETQGLRAGLEGEARSDGFVVLVPRPSLGPGSDFELGFEPER